MSSLPLDLPKSQLSCNLYKTILIEIVEEWRAKHTTNEKKFPNKTLKTGAICINWLFFRRYYFPVTSCPERLITGQNLAWVPGVSGEKGKDGSEKGRHRESSFPFSPFPLPHLNLFSPSPLGRPDTQASQSPDFSARRRRPNLHSNNRRSVSNNRQALLS